jgi:hypothetical protein
MHRIAPWLIILVVLTTTSLYAAGTITVTAGTSQQLHADHGFHAVTVAEGQQDATLSAISDPTSTPVPATPTPVSAVLIEGVPVCTDHDPTTWHPLVKRDSGGNIVCTYGHEHHDDPNAVNDIFGPPGAWYGGTQAISYPWQTASSAGPENAAKHEGYKWYVRRDLPCVPVGGQPGCILAYRVQVHTLGTVADAVVRFHSFSMEALISDHGTTGVVRGGGHMDTGNLGLETDGGTGTVCPPLASNPSTFNCGAGAHRESASRQVPAPHTSHWTPLVNWYAEHGGGLQVGPVLEPFAAIDYDQPTVQLPQHDPAANNSRGRIENLAVATISLPWQPLTRSGLVDGRTWVDRGGIPVSGCTAPAADAFMNANSGGAVFGVFSEHDVVSPVTGGSLIRMPN